MILKADNQEQTSDANQSHNRIIVFNYFQFSLNLPMGRKKRNLPPHSKPPPTEDRAAVDGGASSSVNLSDDLSQEQSKIDPHSPANAPIKLECVRAINAIERGNHAKALRILKDLCLRHEDSPFVHRVEGYAHCQLASLIDDNVTKLRHLQNAVDSARRAVSLSPNSLEYATFYANLLYRLSCDDSSYEEAARECERALSIENPIDPGREMVVAASQLNVSTVEERIANTRDSLQILVQKCRIASSSSTLTENLETRRPNVIQKVVKTVEERRREIEVQVATAKLMQQNLESMQTGLDLNSENTKHDDRRKYASLMKMMPSLKRMDEFKSYWNSMSVEKKRGLLELRIRDLRDHFSSFKDGLATKAFSEAIGFAQKNKTWKFSSCFFCGETFKDSELRIEHIEQEHEGGISSKLKRIMPEEVDADWAEMLVNCTWKPVDIHGALKIIQKKLESVLANLPDDNEYCPKDDEEPNKGQVCSGSESTSHDSEGYLQLMACPDDQKWPISDDVERAKILESIHAEFEMLRRHKCLSKSTLKQLINDTIEELKNFVPISQICSNGLDKTPLCICFMEEPYLKKILRCLRIVSDTCGLNRSPDEGSSLNDELNVYEGKDLKEMIVFNGDSSCLLLDERLLRGELMPCNYEDAVAHDGSAITCTIGHDEVDVLPDSDALMHWLFSGRSIGEELVLWTTIQDAMKHQGMNVIQTIEKEFDLLEMWHSRKSEVLSYEEALQAMESICIEELEKREQVPEHIPQSYVSLLSRRQDELVGEDNDVMSRSSRFELDAISSILKEALTGINSPSSDHEHQEDACIRTAIQGQIDESSKELGQIEGLIVRGFTVARQLVVKFMQASRHDYRSIMLPLLKSFMRAKFEALVNEDAKQKSAAAEEAFLSELALEAKKNMSKGGNNTKLPHGNPKAKKKEKNQRKVKDSKATCGSELKEKIEEQDHFPVGYDGDYQSSEIAVAERPDEFELHEEEPQHEIEHEVEERKLEEMLEYQKKIEDEAKQKNLAKKNKNTVATITEELEKMDVTCSTLSDDSGPGVPVSTLEETKVPIGYDGDYRSSEIVVSERSDEFELQEEEPQHEIEHEVVERKLEKMLEYQKKIKDEAKQKNLGKQNKNAIATRTEELEKMAVTHSTLSDDSGPGVPVSTLEGTKLLDNSSKVQRTTRRRSQTHGKARQGKEPESSSLQTIHVDRTTANVQDLFGWTLVAQESLPSTTSQRVPPKVSSEELLVWSADFAFGNISVSDLFGPGLRNDVGESNSFLNVVIQSLWHLRKFRDEFLSRPTSMHVHIGDSCVVCALHEIFNALDVASTNMTKEVVSPTNLRIALSKLTPDGNLFQEAQMNDASKVLKAILSFLHQSFTSGSAVSDTKSAGSNCTGLWDCVSDACIAHTIFGMDIFQKMNCHSCALRGMKCYYAERSFDELLELAETHHYRMCDTEAGGCGKLDNVHNILSTPPHVFTTVLGWESRSEPADDISATLRALSTEIDIGVMYEGVDPGKIYSLISMVCYHREHYICFIYNHEYKKWIMYDDETPEVIFCWEHVLTKCEEGCLQPQY
ncbi:unnamed protein product [Camellia sinensis]